MADKPIAAWLRETRLRQITPETRQPWTQGHLLDLMKAEVGWAPHRPNYSKYENGKATPEPDTLDKFVAFWTVRGEPGPDLTPRTAPEPNSDPIIAAMDRQTEATRANTEMLRQVLEALTARPPEPPPEVFREIAEEERAALEPRSTKPPRSIVPDHPVEGRGTGSLRVGAGR